MAFMTPTNEELLIIKHLDKEPTAIQGRVFCIKFQFRIQSQRSLLFIRMFRLRLYHCVHLRNFCLIKE
jgi:hypothetical protein